MECVDSSFAYEGSQYIIYDCLHPMAIHITQDARPQIVDAQLMHIFNIGQGACVSFFFEYKGSQYI